MFMNHVKESQKCQQSSEKKQRTSRKPGLELEKNQCGQPKIINRVKFGNWDSVSFSRTKLGSRISLLALFCHKLGAVPLFRLSREQILQAWRTFPNYLKNLTLLLSQYHGTISREKQGVPTSGPSPPETVKILIAISAIIFVIYDIKNANDERPWKFSKHFFWRKGRVKQSDFLIDSLYENTRLTFVIFISCFAIVIFPHNFISHAIISANLSK